MHENLWVFWKSQKNGIWFFANIIIAPLEERTKDLAKAACHGTRPLRVTVLHGGKQNDDVDAIIIKHDTKDILLIDSFFSKLFLFGYKIILSLILAKNELSWKTKAKVQVNSFIFK